MRFLLFILLFMSCAHAKLFYIGKDDHFSSPILTKVFVGTKMDMTVIFDEWARYEFPAEKAKDQGDVNKLYGFSDCWSSHMDNSARFGWRWFNNRLEITAFTHRHGKFYIDYITSIDPNHAYEGSIEISEDKQRYIYTFDGVTKEVERGCDDGKAHGYHLQPFFGGDQPAPHNLTIDVKLNEKFGPAFVDLPYPNPVDQGKFKLKVSAYENIHFYIMIYDVLGRVVYKSKTTPLSAAEERVLDFDIGKGLASALYLIVPVTVLPDGNELRGNVTNKGSDKSLKLLILNR